MFATIQNRSILIMQNGKDKDTSVSGVVTEALPNTLFKVVLEGQEEETLAYLGGKMRMNRIRVLIGDKVKVEVDPYGGKGRIVKRL
jgi:translation initiation factor IF-1